MQLQAVPGARPAGATVVLAPPVPSLKQADWWVVMPRSGDLSRAPDLQNRLHYSTYLDPPTIANRLCRLPAGAAFYMAAPASFETYPGVAPDAQVLSRTLAPDSFC
jgi:hypothetical protein